jgi:hypothetical protein
MGRNAEHSAMRGVTAAHKLLHHGVNCSLSTNNVLNPFTPFGDCSLIRMANLYANICHVGAKADVEECFRMVTTRSAALMRIDDYGIGWAGRLTCGGDAPTCRGGRRAGADLRLQARLPHLHACARRSARSRLGRKVAPVLRTRSIRCFRRRKPDRGPVRQGTCRPDVRREGRSTS